MTDQLKKKWEESLQKKMEYKKQVEAALNQVTAEILQLQGGLQFANEAAEPVAGNTEVTEGEAQ